MATGQVDVSNREGRDSKPEDGLPISSPWHKATWGNWEFLPLIDFGLTVIKKTPSKKLNTTYMLPEELVSNWEFLPLIDFGLTVIKKTPSKKLNTTYMLPEELEKYRHTYEQSNISICPLQILRGFGALHLLANGKTEKAISDIITQALNGYVISKRMNIQEELASLYDTFFESLGCAVIRIYFEDSRIVPYDETLLRLVDERYMEKKKQEQEPESEEESERKRVVNAVCFAMNPEGNTTVALMENDMKKATKGNVKYAIRHDVPATWRARLALVTVFDGTFYWHPPAPVELKSANFYESYTKDPHFRSVVKSYACDGFFRTCLTNRGVRVVELNSDNPNLKMYIFQPTKQEFSNKFMKKVKSEHVQHFIDELPREPEQHKVLIPKFTVVSPLSLRGVFDKPTGFFHWPSPFPSAWRIFSPQRAEFSKIVGKPKYFGATYTFPLWDHYHKTKFSLRIERTDKKPQVTEKSQLKKKPTDDITQKDEPKAAPMRISKANAKITIITRPGQSADSKTRILLGIIEDESGDAFCARDTLTTEGAGDQENAEKKRTLLSQRLQNLRSRPPEGAKIEAPEAIPQQKSEPKALIPRKVPLPPASLQTANRNRSPRMFSADTQSESEKHHSTKSAPPPPILLKLRRPDKPSARRHRSQRSRRSRRSARSHSRSRRSARSARSHSRSRRSARSARRSKRLVNKSERQKIADDTVSTQNSSRRQSKVMEGTQTEETGLDGTQETINGTTQKGDGAENPSSAANDHLVTVLSEQRHPAGADFIVEDTQTDDDDTTNNIEMLRRAVKASPVSRDKQDRSIYVEFDETPECESRYAPPDINLNEAEYDININTPFLYMVVASSAQRGRTFVVSMGRFTNVVETNEESKESRKKRVKVAKKAKQKSKDAESNEDRVPKRTKTSNQENNENKPNGNQENEENKRNESTKGNEKQNNNDNVNTNQNEDKNNDGNGRKAN
ncbi:hypothetical protein Tcan_15534 [Toxocara canis]|uniref:Serpin domain-containing protein n=1 Tax=Toxocara canis TaxID=6265 RepID=A0A0B2VXW2_TOXCA|nr:hypothetical protein Tcan_15534 [Toxocara canis]